MQVAKIKTFFCNCVFVKSVFVQMKQNYWLEQQDGCLFASPLQIAGGIHSVCGWRLSRNLLELAGKVRNA